jgi:hypothetical protein
MACRQKIAAEMTLVLQVLREAGGELFLDRIANDKRLTLTVKTLNRRLDRLVANSEVRVEGRGPATRYRLVGAKRDVPEPSKSLPTQSDLFVPLSKPASDILKRVTAAIALRKPVGYVHLFLDGYRPNQTFYLTVAERKRLADLGMTSMSAGVAGMYAQHVLQRLLIDLSWNSSRLEGNTYSLLDTERLIEFGEAAEGKSQTDAQMIRNHKAAIEFLVQAAFDRRTILNLHGLLAENLSAVRS